MKKYLRSGLNNKIVGMGKRCLLLLCCVLLLAGCRSNPKTKIPEQGQAQEKIDISSLTAEKGKYSDYENACTYYTIE